MIHQISAKAAGQHTFAQGHANSGGQALAQGAGGGFNTHGGTEFRMARRTAVQLAEIA